MGRIEHQGRVGGEVGRGRYTLPPPADKDKKISTTKIKSGMNQDTNEHCHYTSYMKSETLNPKRLPAF